MPAVTINGHRIDVPRRAARSSTPPRRLACACPTSCIAQGKCKECIVEVTSGMDLLVAAEPSTSGT